ncbi:MAG: PKD domain-containing protein, partial [Thermoplasmata archaeon]
EKRVGTDPFNRDTDGDGIYESFGERIVQRYEDIGNFTITLRVRDAWGNTGTDTCLVRVLARDDKIGLRPDNGWEGVVLMLIVAVCIAIPSLFLVSSLSKAKDIKRE